LDDITSMRQPCRSARELPHLRVVAVDELLGALDTLFDALVLAKLLHERFELRQRLRGPPIFGRVRLHLRRAELRHQLVVLVLDVEKFVEHRSPEPALRLNLPKPAA
jgi:hypothetical protein